MSEDPFKIVPVKKPPESKARANAYCAGDDWMVERRGDRYYLTYLSGHFQTEEKTVEITKQNAEDIKNGLASVDEFKA